jgi:hypothetical protein
MYCFYLWILRNLFFLIPLTIPIQLDLRLLFTKGQSIFEESDIVLPEATGLHLKNKYNLMLFKNRICLEPVCEVF